jgi:ribosomal protein S18 acetylase RimI-like enzyme
MEAVSQTVASAYRDAVRRLYGESAVGLYRPRNATQLETLRRAFPEGCLVATEGRSVIGAIFARKWGRLGWFSSLGVEPHLQRRGTGKALAIASTQSLRQSGCHTVGLETWANSPGYTAMYVRMGFRPVAITSQLVVDTDREWPEARRDRILEIDELPDLLRSQVVTAADSICDKLVPGMSIVPEIVLANGSSDKSSIWLVKDGAIKGFGLVDLSPDFDGSGTHSDVWVAALDPADTDADDFMALVGRAAAYGRRAERTRLNIDVSSDYPETFKLLLDAGFIAANQLLRFVDNQTHYRGVDDRPVINIGRWAA